MCFVRMSGGISRAGDARVWSWGKTLHRGGFPRIICSRNSMKTIMLWTHSGFYFAIVWLQASWCSAHIVQDPVWYGPRHSQTGIIHSTIASLLKINHAATMRWALSSTLIKQVATFEISQYALFSHGTGISGKKSKTLYSPEWGLVLYTTCIVHCYATAKHGSLLTNRT